MIKKLLLVLWAFVMFSPYAMANCNCSQPSADAIPPFLGSAVSIPPNVLIVMDISGSMSWSAYTGSYTGTEEGYFDPNSVYSYYQNGGYWYQSNSNTSKCPSSSQNLNNSKSYSGSCLNYLYMTRIDVLQWVLTGGSPASCSNNNQNCDPRLNTSDKYYSGSDIMLTTSNSVNVLTPMSRINNSLLLSLANNTQSTKPRIGLEMFSSNVNASKVYIGDYTASSDADPNNPYTNLIRMVNSVTAGGSTATGPAMKAALD